MGFRMIRSFADIAAARIARGEAVKNLPRDIQQRALRKLLQLQVANRLEDLRVPPGNRLEALIGSRQGQHSIRINDQWRICFIWREDGAYDVEIVDYHR